ncbi:alpha/beta-hydrolase, partial [Eremomyces bilateralis CBS 781.70]
ISSELHDRLVYYSEWATAAYCSPQQGETGGKVSCQTSKTCVVAPVSLKTLTCWFSIGNNSATGFVAADHTTKNIIISMRGSVALANWVADLKFFQTECVDGSVVIGPGFCNIGFLGFWQQSREAAEEGLAQGLQENPSYNIVITGHSLGAAAAVYGASYLRQNAQYKDKIFSYGQPRAGDEAFSKFVTAQGNNYRVTHTSDAVPKLPPESGIQGTLGFETYSHIAPEYYISDGLGMNINNIHVIDSGSSNEGNAGTGQLKFNIVAHIQYFQN